MTPAAAELLVPAATTVVDREALVQARGAEILGSFQDAGLVGDVPTMQDFTSAELLGQIAVGTEFHGLTFPDTPARKVA